MEFCPYCNIAPYNSYCSCNKSNEICPFTRRCSTRMAHVPLASMNNCQLRKEEEMIPTNTNKVRFEKRGKLFIEVENFVIELDNPYDYIPQYVELIKQKGEYFIKGFESKTREEIKKSTKTIIAEKK